jgi:hypothetical protein
MKLRIDLHKAHNTIAAGRAPVYHQLHLVNSGIGVGEVRLFLRGGIAIGTFYTKIPVVRFVKCTDLPLHWTM